MRGKNNCKQNNSNYLAVLLALPFLLSGLQKFHLSPISHERYGSSSCGQGKMLFFSSSMQHSVPTSLLYLGVCVLLLLSWVLLQLVQVGLQYLFINQQGCGSHSAELSVDDCCSMYLSFLIDFSAKIASDFEFYYHRISKIGKGI